ncbi:choice-of-anchor M domain-containing protein [Streptomyces sp. NPDC052236]|uniref:choice-of-anchor M domain-containing protein n=1 Tax=Streptomyces sp. NPDC052236 TaxID=3365686 RepID=UPI0037D53BAE
MRASLSRRTARAAALTAVLSLLAAAPLALAGAAETPPREAPPGERAVLNGGHLDMAARIGGGQLQYRIKDGTVAGAPVWREPSDVLLHFDPRHEIVVPPREDVPQFEGIGEPGESLWVDKDFEVEEGLLWPGWNTTEILPADITGPVKVTFPKIEGPGRFILGLFEEDPQWGTRIGITIDSAKTDPGSVELPAFTHAHPLWIFDAKGVYRITMELSATLPSGVTVTDRETLAVAVGDVDPSTVVPGDGIPRPTPPLPSTTPPSTTPPSTPPPSPTPTTTSTPTPTPTPTPSPTDQPSPTPSASVSASATLSAIGGFAPAGGSLAATGTGVALPAGIAVASVMAGGVAVLFTRGKRAAR